MYDQVENEMVAAQNQKKNIKKDKQHDRTEPPLDLFALSQVNCSSCACLAPLHSTVTCPFIDRVE
jgi:hypothetical protein